MIQITWKPEDVLTLAPSMTLDEAEEWLANNRQHIKDRSIEAGWIIMETLLDYENLLENMKEDIP